MVKLLSTLPAQVLEPLCGLVIPARPVSCCCSRSWRCGCTDRTARRASARAAGTHPTTTPHGRWRGCRSRAGTATPTSPATGSARRGATTSTSSSGTTAATPATTSCAATSPTWSCGRHLLRADGVLHDPYTGQTIAFIRGPRPPRPSRSTMWCRCRTLGTRARATGTISAAATSPTIRATCLPSAQKPTSTRLFAMPPPGCRPTGLPLRVRRAAGRREGRLRAVGFGEREAGDGSVLDRC